jgi:hypothetical protein
VLKYEQVQSMLAGGRYVGPAKAGDESLGPLAQLPGVWSNADNLVGHGWNMIALPYKQPGKTVQPDTPDQKSDFRLLLNQFNETLTFSLLDKGVPNRGAAVGKVLDTDQHLAAIQYVQHIRQIAAIDAPPTPDTPDTPKGPSSETQAIHHEPGLFLHLANQTNGGPDIARLGTIPHGDFVLALGSGSPTPTPGAPKLTDPQLIALFSPLPVGAGSTDINASPYLAPYKKFHDAPFKNLFDPTKPLDLLARAIVGINIKQTTTLQLDTALDTGGVVNIPFVVKQANATSMRAVFWIEELVDLDPQGKPQFMLQYAQRVMLEFFRSRPPNTGLIKWPHITINTMKLTARP